MRELVVKYLNKQMFAPRFRRRPDQGRHHRDRRAGRAGLGQLRQRRADRTGAHAGCRRRRRAGRAPRPPDKAATAVVRAVQGTGGSAFAEQLIASGVKYVFGNSASEDAQFYEALVDRPQLKYILTPHEGPGAAMAAGYIKASGEPTIVMQAAVVGMANAIGQMFNAFKEQTPLVVYSYRTDQTGSAGRDGFEEVAEPGADRPAVHQVHLAGAPRRHDPGDGPPRVQGVVDAAVRPVLHLVALRLQRRARPHRHHRAEPGRSAHARAAESGRRSSAPPSCWSKPRCR